MVTSATKRSDVMEECSGRLGEGLRLWTGRNICALVQRQLLLKDNIQGER
jgi:hypothetical protein